MDLASIRSIRDQLDRLRVQVGESLYLAELAANSIAPPMTPETNPYSVNYLPVHPWGLASRQRLAELEPDLRYIANKLADIWDMTIIWGYRNEAQQTHAYNRGNGLPWPDSNHNVMPSRAVDIARHPLDWDDIAGFDEMIGAAYAIAKEAGIDNMRSGKYFSNRADYAHLELV